MRRHPFAQGLHWTENRANNRLSVQHRDTVIITDITIYFMEALRPTKINKNTKYYYSFSKVKLNTPLKMNWRIPNKPKKKRNRP